MEMQEYFQQEIEKEDWISYYDEPTRKVKYKYENGLNLVSCLCEATVDASIMNLLAMFCEVDLFKNWFPNVTCCKPLKLLTPTKGLYTCLQTMPWPVWPRDMTFTASGMFDRKNNGLLTVLKSVPDDGKYFGSSIPAVEDGHVRIDIQRGFHYFQRIDDNTTKYINIFNADPKLSYTPNWFMNFMMTKVCY